MDAKLHLRLTVRPVLAWLEQLGVRSDVRSEVMLLAIAGQECAYCQREQVGGPARGLYQFERMGGVRGVLGHPASKVAAVAICDALLVLPTLDGVYNALAHNDALACAFARLLLRTDPRPMPDTTEPEKGWSGYLANWRPGRPDRGRWDGAWANARAAVGV